MVSRRVMFYCFLFQEVSMIIEALNFICHPRIIFTFNFSLFLMAMVFPVDVCKQPRPRVIFVGAVRKYMTLVKAVKISKVLGDFRACAVSE